MTVDQQGARTVPWDGGYEEVLRPHLPYAGDTLGPDDVLADLGLDSLETIQLLLGLESAYGVTFPDELLTAETFSTVGALWVAVSALVADGCAG